jgi:peptide/nickel transport system permease protein
VTADADPAPDRPTIEQVDWERLDGRRRAIPWLLVGLVAALGVLAALYRYAQVHNSDLFLRWEPTPLTWVYRVSLVVLAFVVVPPLVRHRERVRRYWRRYRSNRLAVASLAYLVAFTAVALVGPVVVGLPRVDVQAAFQPPLGFSVPHGRIARNCVGPVVGSDISPQCTGSLQHPLGTSRLGSDVGVLLVSGVHVSFQVAVIATVLIVPVATAVGVVAGYVGGPIDTVLMRYVDVQQSVPAFVVYVVLVFVFGPSLLLLVAVFGLLNWGSVARLVRAETLQRRTDAYVTAARSHGASRLTILRRHVLPNVSSTVLVGATQKIPQLVLLETALTFIELGDVGRFHRSFGAIIAMGFDGAYENSALYVWWIWLLPVVVLAVTVVALVVFGDALRDTLDPRVEP